VLALYDFASNRFGGDDFPLDADEGEPVTEEVNYNGKYDFPQEDYDDRNDNGRWDPGWLVRYRTCWHFGTVEAHRLGYPLGTGTEEETDEE
jgi:hypothetical protein